MLNKKNIFIIICLLICIFFIYPKSKLTYSKIHHHHSNIAKNNKTVLSKDTTQNNSSKKTNSSEKKLCKNHNAKSTKPQKSFKSKNYTYADYFYNLKKIGYYKNIFNDENLNFRYAVLKFQSSKNLICDGIIGSNTSNLLMNNNYYNTYDSIPNFISKGYIVIINKDKRILTVYLNGKVLKKYPIASGSRPSYTPEGKFKIVSKLINPTWISTRTGKTIPGGVDKNPLGKRWIGLSIGGGSLYGIHGNCNPWSIGTNSSLGCIRMFNNDVSDLFNYIPTECPVWIGCNSKLNLWNVVQK